MSNVNDDYNKLIYYKVHNSCLQESKMSSNVMEKTGKKSSSSIKDGEKPGV